MQKPYGIVVCGGKSSRMGMDKCLIDYHGKSQWKHVLGMLKGICAKVLVSCSNDQATGINFQENLLIDLPQYQNIGPMAALLTAFESYPNESFLLVGCDYPFLTKRELDDFLISIDGKKTAYAFYNKAHQIYEPLLAWYSQTSKNELLRMFNNQEYSLQHFLRSVNAQQYIPLNIESINSVDTPEEYEKAKNVIDSQKQL